MRSPGPGPWRLAPAHRPSDSTVIVWSFTILFDTVWSSHSTKEKGPVDTVAVIVQVLFAVAFVAAGAMHLRFARGATPSAQMGWVTAVPPNGLAVIALLEMVGGAVLAVTAFTGPAWLAGLTAVCFVAFIGAAAVFHL